MKMRRASDIDDDPVVLVGRDDRRIVLQRPEGESFERFGVGLRIGVLDDQTRGQRLRLGYGHADA